MAGCEKDDLDKLENENFIISKNERVQGGSQETQDNW